MLGFDAADLNMRSAVIGSIAVALVVGAVIAWGGGAAGGVFGFVLTYLAFAANPADSPTRAAMFAVIGGVLTFLAFSAADDMALSAILLGGVSIVGSLSMGRSAGDSVRWSLLTLWTLVAMLLVEEGSEVTAGAGFVIGSLLATGMVYSTKKRTIGETSATPEEANRPAPGPIGFVILKGVTVASSVVIGFLWFPETPYWVALTLLIVLQPGTRSTLRTALERTLGTLLGVGAGLLVIAFTDGSEPWLALILFGLIFGQMLFMRVNYVIYAMFLTAVIIVAAALTGVDPGDYGWLRVTATVVGALLALAVTALMARIGPTPAIPES